MQIRKFTVILLFSLLFAQASFAAGGKKTNAGKRVEFIADALILEMAKELGAFDHKLVLAIIKIESGNNRFAYNGADKDGRGTYGLLQLKIATAKYMGFSGKASDLYDWKTNLKYGVRYINYQYRRYGSVPSTLAAFNAGSVIMCKKTSNKRQRCTPGTFVNQNYVRSVLYHYRKILDLDNNSLLASEKR